jgi:hypothetical protein
MTNTATLIYTGKKYKTAILDVTALLIIYLTPAISHLFSFPVYLLEPMRIMLILAVVHTSRKNAYLLALTLPLFSFLISSHPSIIKTMLITGELFLNIWLFFYLKEKVNNIFNAAFISIIISKLGYYSIKFLLISTAVLSTELISTPLFLQLAVTIILSGYLFFFSDKQ